MNNFKNDIHIWIIDKQKIETNKEKDIFSVIVKQYGLSSGDLKYYKTGKPYFKGKDIKISKSQRNNIVVYAFSYKDEIGIDIEKMSRLSDIENFSKYIFLSRHAKDIINIIGADKISAFYTYWTLYEACAKLTGKGLVYILQNKLDIAPKEQSIIDNNFFCTFKIKSNYIGTVMCGRKKYVKFIKI